jgi:hypothetical protein
MKMEEYKRITDQEAFKIIDEILNDTPSESLEKDLAVTQLKLLIDIRQFLRKLYQNMPRKTKVYKRPTNNSNDVIVGK